ncbi:hypothetical protein EVAR_50204_1 [Eumeta japonica]|uniref:Uncharacterized protein n=1 Tax=Eumeta variegata TaxID=151549 RepID=A0A4C1WWH6_EUMVA|nr:hypothetical protein EVAR_50204_1 [Eumeta japonica]
MWLVAESELKAGQKADSGIRTGTPRISHGAVAIDVTRVFAASPLRKTRPRLGPDYVLTWLAPMGPVPGELFE